MAETFRDAMLVHLAGEQRKVNAAITAVHEISNNGSKYKTADRTALVTSVVNFDTDCAICREFAGNDGP